MRLFTATLGLVLALLAAGNAFAEEIVLNGKTFSPNRMEIFSPHALAALPSAGEASPSTAKDSDAGAGSETTFAPFTQMKITKLLADIGQKVTADQHLLEFDYPHEGLIAERRKLSPAGLMTREASLEKIRADTAQLRASLAGAQALRDKGVLSSQNVNDMVRELQLKTLREQALASRVELDRGVAQGSLDAAQKKFGKTARERRLTGRSWITAPVAGFVLWANPDLKPGMILTQKTRLFVVGSLDPIVFRADVYEEQAVRLRVGDKVRVTFEALPGRTFDARLARVAVTPLPGGIQTSSQYEVEITLPNPGLALKEGVRGEASVQVPDGPRQ